MAINTGDIKNKQNTFSAINGYSSSVKGFQIGNNLGQSKIVEISPRRDNLTISAEGIGMLQEQEANVNPCLTDENNLESLMESYRDELDRIKDSKSAFEDMAKLMEIARRISRGDKVPLKDEKKLMEFNAKLYQAAKAAAMLNANKKHKKYKSMFDDEENNDIRNKLKSLEQEDKAAARSGDMAADAVTVDIELSTEE